MIVSNSIEKTEEEIVEEFELFGEDINEKYWHIISLGKSIKFFPIVYLVDGNKVRGCQSDVWLIARFENGMIFFEGESDSDIVKGLMALLFRILSGRTPDEIINARLGFIERIGLNSIIHPQRQNGLAAMIKQMKFYALAYKAKLQNTAQ